MRPCAPIALSVALCGAAVSATVDIPPSSPAVRIFARTYEPTPDDVQWSWSGSGALIAFDGTSCSALLSARGSLYRVLVDGKETRTLDLSNSNDTLIPLASGLSSGSHVVEIRQRTEANYSTARFHGFRIDGVPGTAPAESPRRIEFYGNSITCGYGIIDSVASHSFSVQTEDEGRTFASQATDSLGAEHRTVCWSGKGVLQNYGKDTVNPTLPKLHKQILPWDVQHLWDFSRWIPQVVVIDLGTNDFSTTAPDSTRFHDTYMAFVDTLHGHHPSAKFVLVDGPMLSDGYPAGMNALTTVRRHLDNIVAAATVKGISASHLMLTPQDNTRGYGADWHPNIAQATLNGQELTAHLRGIMGWTGKPSVAAHPLRGDAFRLEATKAGWSLRIPEGAAIRSALLVDAHGRVLRSLRTSFGGSLPLPSLRRIAWLRLSTSTGNRTLAIPPRMR